MSNYNNGEQPAESEMTPEKKRNGSAGRLF